jgi:hypothetical protein
VWQAVAVAHESLVGELWQQQSVWSRTANRMKAGIGRSRSASLALTVVSAILAASAGLVGQPIASAGLALAAAVGVGVLPILRPGWTGAVLRDWTRARSVSEALKSEVYLYLTRAGDYRGEDRNDRLANAADLVTGQAADLLRHCQGVEPASRALPDVYDLRSYFAVRVDDQIDGYYRPKARDLQVRLRRFRAVAIGLSVLAVVLGALAARLPEWGLAPWLAVVTTIAATVSAHVGTSRYEYQLLEYLRTADELSRLRSAAARVA